MPGRLEGAYEDAFSSTVAITEDQAKALTTYPLVAQTCMEVNAAPVNVCLGCGHFPLEITRAFTFRPDQVQLHEVYPLRAWAMPPDIRRALELLAGARQGRSADVLAYDVGPEVLPALVRAGLASQVVEHLPVPGAQPIEITRVRITDAGRQAFRTLKARGRPGAGHRGVASSR